MNSDERNKKRLIWLAAFASTPIWPFGISILVFSFLFGVIIAILLSAAFLFLKVFVTQWTLRQQFQALDIQSLEVELERMAAHRSQRGQRVRYVSIVILVLVGVIMLATNPRLDAFQSFAASKGYVFPNVEQHNFLLFSVFSIRGISGESHAYVGAFNQFLEVQ